MSGNSDRAALIDSINAALPQTQCTRCGYPDCHSYAQAIGLEQAPINQCPPGGATGIMRLAQITEQAVQPLNSAHGTEGPRQVAFIDEDWCIGCTLCFKACPVDCIIGSNKTMHTVIEALCTGCELCIPACPIDCIQLEPITQTTGWEAWSEAQALQARTRYTARQERREQQRKQQDTRLLQQAEYKKAHLEKTSKLTDPQQLSAKQAILEAALARARANRQNNL